MNNHYILSNYFFLPYCLLFQVFLSRAISYNSSFYLKNGLNDHCTIYICDNLREASLPPFSNIRYFIFVNFVMCQRCFRMTIKLFIPFSYIRSNVNLKQCLTSQKKKTNIIKLKKIILIYF